jgi:hypothetical protein
VNLALECEIMQKIEEKLSPFEKRRFISINDWENESKATHIAQEDMNKLIMNFFLVEGYKDAAQMFSKETGVNRNLSFA